VKPDLRDPKLISDNLVHDSVLTIDSARPITLERVLQWLGLTDATMWLAHNFLDQKVDSPDLLQVSR
jgi:hypothetical protein